MRQPSMANADGFTLLEVLIGFAVTALLMTILLQAFTRGLGMSARSTTYTAAVLMAQSAMDGAGVLQPLHDGFQDESVNGRFDIVTLIRRRMDLSQADPRTLYVVPYEVSVTVVWREGSRNQSLNLRGLKLGPQSPQ
jgi:general secretion pathway protein I